MERRANPTPAEQIAVGNRRIDAYNRRLLWLTAATAAVLIVLMFFTLLKVLSLAEEAKQSSREAVAQSKENADRGRDIKVLLQRQAANDANRQQFIDDAVAAIAAEQYRALVAHDTRVQQLLADGLRIGNQELNGAENQEERVFPPIPRPAPRPAPMGPSTAVQQPAPVPEACEQRGNSGKCRK